MAVYASTLAQKAARKRALQSTEEMDLPDATGEESDSDPGEMPDANLLPQLEMKAATRKGKTASPAQPANRQPVDLDGKLEVVRLPSFSTAVQYIAPVLSLSMEGGAMEAEYPKGYSSFFSNAFPDSCVDDSDAFFS